MLTDLTLRNLKPRVTLYKVTDRDGMYVAITPTGSISFRFDYRINGRRETLTIGRYGYGGISLAAARGKLLQAKQLLRDGISPALQKRRKRLAARKPRRLVTMRPNGCTEPPWLNRHGRCARAC